MAGSIQLSVPKSFDACTDSLIGASLTLEKNLQAKFARECLHSLLGLHLTLEQSLEAWQQVHALRAQLSRDREFEVPFRQALLEYFLHSTLLQQPVITEFSELERLRLNSMTDHLTGVYNRQFFDATIPKEVKRATRYHEELSLVLMDLNRFKEVNDTHGHATGDSLLEFTGKLLAKNVRTTDSAFRIGGDEFALILPQTPHPNATFLADRLGQQFQEQVKSQNLTVRVALGYGVATAPREARDSKGLFELADHRLYEFKRSVGSPRCFPRRFERINLKGLDAYVVFKAGDETCRSPLLDFSVGGIGLKVPPHLDLPESFSGDLHLQFLPPVPVQLRKAYVGEVSPEGRRLGCAFLTPPTHQKHPSAA